MQPPKGTIEFENVSKRYRLGAQGTLRGTVAALFARSRNSSDERRTLWAVRDVSFRLSPGESLGLIGPNGSGKTTTLKLLSGITLPTEGRIAVHGRTSALIELGAGFHPELSGLENIFLNGAILGLKRHEIEKKLSAIIDFSGLERFIDTPVKRYSSGMYVRLGFAVAAHVEPDVLLVDEVLAVGDASFRHRCIQHMQELRKRGTTVLFVSHNMHLVRRMCDSVLLLMNGQIRAQGPPSDIISEYESLMQSHARAETTQPEHKQPASNFLAKLILTSVKVQSDGGAPASLQHTESPGSGKGLESHLPAKVTIHYQATSSQPIGRIDARIIRSDGTLCATVDSSQAPNAAELSELCGKGIIEFVVEPLQLTSGQYHITVQITDLSDGMVIASTQSSPFNVHSLAGGADRGIYAPRVRWVKHEGDN
jgi:ABC-type polysaccharide/polyol phosphate transport system ATPase subunit